MVGKEALETGWAMARAKSEGGRPKGGWEGEPITRDRDWADDAMATATEMWEIRLRLSFKRFLVAILCKMGFVVLDVR